MFTRRLLRRFLLYVCAVLFVFLFLARDDDIEKVSQKKQTEHPSNILGFGASPKDARRLEDAEDAIFGQGIVIHHVGSRSNTRQDKLDSREEDAAGGDETQPARYRNVINDPSGTESKHESSNGLEVGSVKTEDLSPHQKGYPSQNYPLRYQGVLDEAQNSVYNIPDQTNIEKHVEKALPVNGIYEERYPVWMRITDDIHTYSAFWDSRPDLPEGPVVRILGILRFKKDLLYDDAAFRWNGNIKPEMLNCSCLIWYKGRTEPHQGHLKAFIFEEGRELFVGTFFLCYPRTDNSTNDPDTLNSHVKPSTLDTVTKDSVPYAVSLYPDNTINAPHKLIYLDHKPSSTGNSSVNKNCTAVCVRALFGPYNDISGLIQFVSYYATVLKVSNFYLYDLAIGFDVSRLLKTLSTIGLSFEILPWNLPTSEWGELWDIGSLTAINDCVYRTIGRHSHVAIVDLDEFIVPRTPVTGLPDLYQKILQFRRGHHGDAALIPNVFFCFDFEEAPSEHHNNNSFPIFKYVHREARIWPMKSRSKIVIVPDSIVSVGHHMVHNFVLKSSENRGSPKLISVLHHYRTCEDLHLGIHAVGGRVLDEATVKDAYVMKYKKAIMTSRAMELYKKHFLLER